MDRRDADDTFFPIRNTAEIQRGGTQRFRKVEPMAKPIRASIRSDVMSYTTISKPLSAGHLHRLKKRGQRGLAIEQMLIVLLIAFTAFQFLFVVGTKAM
jgi:hypothetical protein